MDPISTGMAVRVTGINRVAFMFESDCLRWTTFRFRLRAAMALVTIAFSGYNFSETMGD